jgi:hypothetical protein
VKQEVKVEAPDVEYRGERVVSNGAGPSGVVKQEAKSEVKQETPEVEYRGSREGSPNGDALQQVKEESSTPYEGEINAAGQPEGQGTYTYVNGDIYEGAFKAGKKGGWGTYYTQGDGAACIGWFRGTEMLDEGVRWSADRQEAWRLQNGEVQAKIRPNEAREVAARIGLPVPPTARTE